MSQSTPFEMQVIGASLDEIREVLGITGSMAAGNVVPLTEGTTLKIEEVSKSSGFDVTTVILTAVISIATSASSEVLIEWLKSRLFKNESKPSTVTILIDGKEIQVRMDS